MILKVTINEGMGKVRCSFPGFTLDENRRKSIFVYERTEQLKALEDEAIVSIETVTETEYEEAVARASKVFTAKAIADKRAALNRLIKTGGKDKIITGSGLTVTVEPGDATPEEISKEAQEELDMLNAQVGDEPPVDEIGNYLKDSGV